MKISTKILAASALSLTLVGCTTIGDTTSADATKTATETTASSTTGKITDPAALQQIEQNQLQWVLTTLNEHGGKVEEKDVKDHFDQTFLNKLDTVQTKNVLAQLGTQIAPVTVQTQEFVTGNNVTVAHANTKVGRMAVIVSVDKESQKMNGLFFKPDTAAGAPGTAPAPTATKATK